MYNEYFFSKNKKKPVYQWELKKIEEWDDNTIKNRIWTAVELGQSIPGCVSVEALRVELMRRGQEPIGYHEDPESVDVSNIEIVPDVPVRRRGR